MSRRLALAATAAVLVVAVAAPAMAWPFGKKTDAPAAAAAPAKGAATTAAAPAGPQKATAQQRAEAEGMEPLVRAAFWAREAGLDPKDEVAGVKSAQSLRGIGRNDEAADAAQKVLMMHPGDFDALMELARADVARNQGFYAIDPARRAAAEQPKDWRPQSLLGVALDQVSRPDDARAAWTTALKLSPDNPAVLSNLAMSYFTSGDAPQAESLLRRAVAQPGATLQTRQNLALVLGMQGRMAEAEKILREDLPPELAEQNLAWLRAHVTTTGVAGAKPAPARTWGAVAATSGN
jgi:Flp pilus assembly protein TadD